MKLPFYTLILLFFIRPLNAQSPIDSTLVIHYSFDGDATDYSLNHINGIPHSVSLIEDKNSKLNSAYFFDGNESYIEIPGDSTIKPQFPMSFSTWIKPTSFQVPIFTNDFQHDRYTGILVFISSYGSIGVTIGNGGTIGYYSRSSKVGTTILNLYEWYHIACIIRGINDIEIYINGVNDNGEYSGLGDSLYYSDGIGAVGLKDQDVWGDPAYFKGIIDELYFFKKQLSEEEIQELYSKGNQYIAVGIPTLHGNPGDTLYIPINVSFPPDFSCSSFELQIENPWESLSYLSFRTDSSLIENLDWIISENPTDSIIYISGAGVNEITNNGILIYLKVIINSSTLNQFIPVRISSAIFNNDLVESKINQGGIVITNFVIKGDVDQDGSIRAFDSSLILKYLVNLISLTEDQIYAADVSLDSTVSSLDALLILQYVSEIIDTLPYNPSPNLKYAVGDVNMIDQFYDGTQYINIPILLSQAENIVSFCGEISFNPSHLKFESIHWSDSFKNYAFEINSENDKIMFAGLGDVVSGNEFIFANLLFSIRDLNLSVSSVILKKLRWNEGSELTNVAKASIFNVTDIEEPANFDYSLYQNYPNPFNPITNITYSIPVDVHVNLALYDVLGNEVKTIVNNNQSAGKYTVMLDASHLPSGVYLYRITAGFYSETKKLLLTK